MDSSSEGKQHRRTLLGRVILDSGLRVLLGIYDDPDCIKSADHMKVKDGNPYFTRYDHSSIVVTANERQKHGHNYRYWEFEQISPARQLTAKIKSNPRYQTTSQ